MVRRRTRRRQPRSRRRHRARRSKKRTRFSRRRRKYRWGKGVEERGSTGTTKPTKRNAKNWFTNPFASKRRTLVPPGGEYIESHHERPAECLSPAWTNASSAVATAEAMANANISNPTGPAPSSHNFCDNYSETLQEYAVRLIIHELSDMELPSTPDPLRSVEDMIDSPASWARSADQARKLQALRSLSPELREKLKPRRGETVDMYAGRLQRAVAILHPCSLEGYKEARWAPY